MYQFSDRIRYSELDENGLLSLTGIINYLQDCAIYHTEDFGDGMKWLRERDRAWLLSSWNIEIFRRPVFGDRIHVITKPYDFVGVLGYRWFEIRDIHDEILVTANSIWCYVQPSVMKPVRILEEDKVPYLPLDEPPAEKAKRKLPLPKEGMKQEPFFVIHEHLDTNHHVNNGQYVNMAAAYLPESFEIGGIQVEYRKQALLGDRITPVVTKEADKITVVLGDEEKTVYAIVVFLSKEVKND